MNAYVNFQKTPLVEVLACTLEKAEIAMGQATFHVEHTTRLEWFDVTTPDGYSTGKRDFDVITSINKISVWCMPGLELDVTSAFIGENQAYEDDFTKAIEQEVERQERTAGKQSEPDYDFMNDDLWQKRTDIKPCPSFAHLQSHKTN